ncbi:hypothetical protein H8D85_00255 [bacterium]|nr:hypothetical protein [bacterium]
MSKIMNISDMQIKDSSKLRTAQSKLQSKECNLCHYAPELRKSFLFPVSSDGTGRLLVVGQQTFMEEHKNSTACSGPFRTIFSTYLKRYTGLTERDCTFTYAVKCTGSDAEKAKTLEYKNCSRYLLQELKMVNPVVLVFLGKDASKSLIDNKTRNSQPMGKPFQYFIMGKMRWCYFMLNPIVSKTSTATVPTVEAHFKGLGMFFSKHTTLYETVTKPATLDSVNSTERQYILVDTLYKLEEMERIINKYKFVGMDTETNSLHTWGSSFKVVGISLAVTDKVGYYIPFGHKSPGKLRYKQLAWKKVKPVIERIVQDPTKQTIWHNLYYDYSALKRMGIDIFKLDTDKDIWTHDSMLMTYLHNENPMLGLKHQMYLHFNIIPKKFKGVLEGADVNTFEDVAPRDALQYAADDAINCLILFNKVAPLVGKESKSYTGDKLLSRIYPYELKTIKALADAHARGIKVDNDYLIELEKAVEEDIKKTQADIVRISTAVSNISSNPKLLELLDSILESTFIDRFNAKFGELNVQERTLRILGVGYERYWNLFKNKNIDASTKEPYKVPGKWEPIKLQNYLTLIIKYKHLNKVKSTYIDAINSLKSKNEEDDWTIHANIKSIGTTSGRMSSNNPNLQNIPRAIPAAPMKCEACECAFKDDNGALDGVFKADNTLSRYTCIRCNHVTKTYTYDLRRLYIPRKGMKFIAADYRNMELYLAAAVSGCQELYDVFLKREIDPDDPNGDMHVVTASSILGITPDEWKTLSDSPKEKNKKKAKEARTIAKTVNFLTLYGGSAEGLQRTFLSMGLDKTNTECEGYINAFFNAYPALKKWFEEQKYEIKNYGRLVNNYGRIRHVLKQGAESLSAINMLIQGLGAQIVKESLVELNELSNKKNWHTLLVIHDENIVEVPENDLEEAGKAIQDIMQVNVYDKIDVGLKVDASVGMSSLSKADSGLFKL